MAAMSPNMILEKKGADEKDAGDWADDEIDLDDNEYARPPQMTRCFVTENSQSTRQREDSLVGAALLRAYAVFCQPEIFDVITAVFITIGL